MFIRLSDSAREMLKARAIAVGPRGGRYYVGSERKDGKGRKVRSYVGHEVPHESRWAPEVRASHDARDARLPPEGHALTRHWQGKEVRVVESGGQFTVHVDGAHAGAGRSLSGALSKALGRPVSGYSFLRLGSANEPASRDWAAHARGAESLSGDLAKRYAGWKVVVEHKKGDGLRAHVLHEGKHFVIDADAAGKAGDVFEQIGEGRGAKWKGATIAEAPKAAEPEKSGPAEDLRFTRQNKYDAPRVGEMLRTKTGNVVVIHDVKSRFIPDDGMSFGLPYDSGWVFTASTRHADKDELDAWNKYEAGIDARKAAAGEQRALGNEIKAARDIPDGVNYPEGEKLLEDKTASAYGGGSHFVVGPKEIWYVWGNSADGDDWSRNNVYNKSSIGWRVPYSEALAERIRKADAALKAPEVERPTAKAKPVEPAGSAVAAKPVNLTSEDDDWRAASSYVFRGNTYATRDSIRAAGGRWDPDRKVWTLRNSGISTKFLRGLQRAGVNIEVIKSLFLRLPKARR
jgi:hypothetical protein